MRFRSVSAAISLLALVALAGCSSAPSASQTFAIHGTFVYGLGNVTRSEFPAGSGCDFQTPIKGRQVTVVNQSGAVVQTGTIGSGTTSWSGGQAWCNYALDIDKVPAGEKFYRLKLNHAEPTEWLTESQIRNYVWHAQASGIDGL